MDTLLVSLFVCGGVFGLAASFVWALRIQRYIESHGERSACVLWNGAGLRDYKTARQIAKRLGRKPRFLIWFEGLTITALAFVIAGIFAMLIASLK
jgi:hypothetical protein